MSKRACRCDLPTQACYLRRAYLQSWRPSNLGSQPCQIGVNRLHTVDSAENGDREIALRIAVHAARQSYDAAVRIDVEPAALEGWLELQASLPGIGDCRIGCRIIDDDDEIRDAMVSKSRGDPAGLFRLGVVAGFAADHNDIANLNHRQLVDHDAVFDECSGEVDDVRLR